MKLIRCFHCGMPIALTHQWQNCECGRTGGSYRSDGDKAVVAGSVEVYGISNKLFLGLRAECWPYDESNGKVKRLAENPGRFPDRVPA